MTIFDIEFQYQELGVWFRINDIKAENEDQAYDKAHIRLKETTGIDAEEFARQHNTMYYIEIPYKRDE